MFDYGDNTLLGMRAEETLVVIEVFDRASPPFKTFSRLWNISDFVRFQVLNSSLDDPALRSQCLYGLQKVSARCGLLPKSYWVSLTDFAEPDGCFSAAKGVSTSAKRSDHCGRCGYCGDRTATIVTETSPLTTERLQRHSTHSQNHTSQSGLPCCSAVVL